MRRFEEKWKTRSIMLCYKLWCVTGYNAFGYYLVNKMADHSSDLRSCAAALLIEAGYISNPVSYKADVLWEYALSKYATMARQHDSKECHYCFVLNNIGSTEHPQWIGYLIGVSQDESLCPTIRNAAREAYLRIQRSERWRNDQVVKITT